MGKDYADSGKRKIVDRERREKITRFIQEYKLSKGCSICGYNRCAAALDFHHPNDDKKYSIGKIGTLKTVKAEIKKCILLCANCHRELHDKERNNDNLS